MSFYTLYTYGWVRKGQIAMLNQQLSEIAFTVTYVLIDDFHDEIFDNTSVTPEEFRYNMKNLQSYARYRHFEHTEIKYIYTVMKFGNDYYFTSSNDPDDYFFKRYKDVPEGLKQMFADGNAHFSDYTSSYGSFHSAFVPFKDTYGRIYAICIDLPLDFVHKVLFDRLIEVFATGAVPLLIYFFVSFIVIRRMFRPLSDLTEFTKKLTGTRFQLKGDIEREIKKLSENQRDEVGSLALAMYNMNLELDKYIAELQEATSARERMESELNIARDIQMGILNRKFPAFPDVREFDIHAVTEPAKLVGGDLYVFNLLSGGRLFFLIGDVSGKGIPAAIFMAVANTLCGAYPAFEGNWDLSGFVKEINRHLSRNNPSLLFVTMFLCVLDLNTGDVEYVDCGHDLPFILRVGRRGHFLDKSGGLVLCAVDNYDYKASHFILEPGDAVILYTDGLTDALNMAGESFGSDAIHRIVESLGAEATAEEINNTLMNTVKDFIGATPQFDDITILTVRYNGKPEI